MLEQARTEWGTELRERDESEKTRFISIRLNLNTLLRLLLIRFVHISKRYFKRRSLHECRAVA